MISQVGMVGRKNISQPSLKTSNLLLPSLIKGFPVQILIIDSEPKDPSSKKVSSTVHAPTSSLPSKEVPQHLLGNEDLAWDRFTMAVMDVDVSACYNMSLKDFEHSGVHDLFKVSLFYYLLYIYIYILSLTSDADIYLTKL